jgi:transglutaminase-like putative cysteine protease
MRYLFLTLLLFAASFAFAQPVRTGTIPAWTTLQPLPYNNTSLDDEASDGYIDLAYERQVSLKNKTVFIRCARKVLSETGVQNASEVSVDYDPGYQRLIMHNVVIRRGNSTINKLNARKFQVIRQEKERGMYLYNGQLTAFLVLDDVRQGDIIEYSYSLEGFNPVFGGRYAAQFDLRYSVPIYRIYYKLLVPDGRNLQVRSSKGAVTASPVRAGNETVYEWSVADSKPLKLEDRVPGWYDPFPIAEVTEFTSWKDVIDWACGLFPVSGEMPASIRKLTSEWLQKYPTNEGRALAALRFVQDDIRYLGIEMGASTHRPHAPAQVFAQRFGDCKDKAYLFCTLLRSMNIEAWPVLTNTEDRRSVTALLPTPFAFDHCTAQAIVDGKTYWFDATSTGQRGKLADISYPDYQVGLVVKPGNQGFSNITLQDNGRIETLEKFTMADFTGKGQLLVNTVYTGSWADATRNTFRSRQRRDKLKDYQDYYANYFDKITADSIRFVDDEKENRFTVFEYYSIRDLWKKNDGESRHLSVFPFVVNAYLHKPSDVERKMPFSVDFPVRVRERIEIEMPEDWPMESFDDAYSAPGFRLTTNGRSEGNLLLINYSFETTADHVRASDMDTYMQAYREANDNVGHSFSYSGDGTVTKPVKKEKEVKQVYKPITLRDLYPVFYVMLGLAVLITWLIRRNRRKA